MAGPNQHQGLDQSRRGFLKGGASLIIALVGGGVTTQLAGCGGGGGTPEIPDNRPSLNASLNTAMSATWLEAGGVSTYTIQLPISASLSPVAILSGIPVGVSLLDNGSYDPATGIFTVKISTGRSVTGNNLSPVITIHDGNYRDTPVTLPVQLVKDTLPPKITSTTPFPANFSQGESKTHTWIFDEEVSTNPVVRVSGLVVSNPILSADKKSYTVTLTANQSIGAISGTIAVTDGTNATTYSIYSSVIDILKPTITLTTRPSALSSVSNPSFVIESSETLSKLEVSIDGGTTWIDIPNKSSYQYTSTGDGNKDIRFRATDMSSNISDVSNYTWNIDTAAPIKQSGTTSLSGEITTSSVHKPSNTIVFDEAINTASWQETSGSGFTLTPPTIDGSQISYGLSYDSTIPAGTYTLHLKVTDTATPVNNAIIVPITLTINKLAAPSAPTLTTDDFNHLVFPAGKTAADYEVSTDSGTSWSPAVTAAYAAGTYQIRLIETAATSAGLPQTLTITTANVIATIPATVDAAGFIGQFDFAPYLQSGWIVVVEGSTTIPNASLIFNPPVPVPRPGFAGFVDLNGTKVDVYEPNGAFSGISFNVPTKFRFQNPSGEQSDVINILFNNVTTQ